MFLGNKANRGTGESAIVTVSPHHRFTHSVEETKIFILNTIVTGGLKQMREINGGSGESSENSLPAEFGLGTATIVDSIIVRWPAADTTNILTNINVNQFLIIYEPFVPLIVSIDPSDLYQGITQKITISGKNTHFTDGSGVLNVWINQGDSTIFASNFNALSNTLLEAWFDVPLSAPLGAWSLSVETGLDGTIFLQDALTMNYFPAIINIEPAEIYSSLARGDSEDVAVVISNSGGSDLIWSARRQYGSPPLQRLIEWEPINQSEFKTGEMEYHKSAAKPFHPFTVSDVPFDLQFSFNVGNITGLGNTGSEFDGNYFYTTRWASRVYHTRRGQLKGPGI
jgi:hypothetical protein